jgi:hypothetical protein
MGKTEFDGISEEDLERFKGLLVRFYQKPWEESYLQLRKEIEERLLRKDTNKNYKSYFVSNLNDLVMTVVSRFIKINSKLHRAGKEILNFHAMLENRIGHVYHEELRRLSKSVRLIDVDDSDISSPMDSIDKEMEENEARIIKAKCYKKCLDELPGHILNIFLDYYDMDELPPTGRADARQKLALQVATIPVQEVTPEKLKRAKNNLDSMICKWRKKHLEPCRDKCLKQKSSH